MSAVHVIGFGNPWHGDDGFGLAVCRHLAARAVPAHVRIIEAGIAGFAALPWFVGCAKVIVVDALRAGGAAGTVRRLSADALAPGENPFSAHALGVNHLLACLEVLGERAPETVIIGVEIAPPRLFVPGLSAAVAAAIEPAARRVAAEWELATCTS